MQLCGPVKVNYIECKIGSAKGFVFIVDLAISQRVLFNIILGLYFVLCISVVVAILLMLMIIITIVITSG